MKNKAILITAAVIVVVIAVYIGLLYYAFIPFMHQSDHIEVVNITGSGKFALNCTLEWHGRDNTTIKCNYFQDMGHSETHYTLLVKNGDRFNFVVTGGQWAEFSYEGKKAVLYPDGTIKEVTEF